MALRLLLIALLLVIPAGAISPPELISCLGSLGALSPDIPLAERFALSQADSLTRLQAHDPTVDAVDVRPTPRFVPDDSDGYQWKVDVTVRNARGTEVAGYTEYTIRNGVLDVYSTVFGRYREAGLNRLMLLRILREHPDISSMHNYLMETNHAAFVVAVASEAEGATLRRLVGRYLTEHVARQSTDSLFIDELRGLRGKPAVRRYRERLLAAYLRDTPVGRMTVQSGLGHLASITVRIDATGRIDIESVSERGPYLGNTPGTRIVFRDDTAPPASRYREFLVDGSVRRTAADPNP